MVAGKLACAELAAELRDVKSCAQLRDVFSAALQLFPSSAFQFVQIPHKTKTFLDKLSFRGRPLFEVREEKWQKRSKSDHGWDSGVGCAWLMSKLAEFQVF